MKIPKEMKRYCPSCKKHTAQKVKNEKGRGRNKEYKVRWKWYGPQWDSWIPASQVSEKFKK